MTTYEVDRKRWAKLNIFEQMGNIYSEVGRSFKAKRLGNLNDSQAAEIRALDLFDATIEQLVKQKSPKSKEVLRAKEEYLQAYHSEIDDSGKIDRYFLQLATAARRSR